MALNDKQLAWFIRHFKHTKNDEICAKLGISISYLHVLARKYNLAKSRQFMRKTQAAATEAARVAVANENEEQRQRRREIARQNNQKGRFTVGVYALGKKSAEELAIINQKRRDSWQKTRHADEVRLNWGYEQQTNFHFARHQDPQRQRSLMALRCNLRKQGYLIPQKGGMVAYITTDTKRSEQREKHAQKLGMIIREQAA